MILITYKDSDFYTNEYRKQFEIVDKAKINTLKGHEHVLDRYEIHLFSDGYGGVFNCESGKYLKPKLGKESMKMDYFRYTLVAKDNKIRTCYTHRLLGLAFIEGYRDNYIVNHKDLDKKNSCISNLEWISSKENWHHAKENGAKVGRPKIEKKPKVYKTKLELSQSSNNGRKQLSYDDVSLIFDMIQQGVSMTKIANKLEVSQPAISQIVNGKRWSEHPASIEYKKVKIINDIR